jgi:hypothetical protein
MLHSVGEHLILSRAELNSIIASSGAVLYSHEILVPGHSLQKEKSSRISLRCATIFLLPQMIAFILLVNTDM